MGSTAHSVQSQRNKKKSEWFKWLKRHIAVPHHVLTNARYRSLSHTAKALLNDLLIQGNGYNNGDFSAAQTVMAPLGWADATRKRAVKALVESEILIVTRVGGKHKCCLYAVSWFPIDECNQKLDVASTTRPPIDFIGENNRRSAEKRKGVVTELSHHRGDKKADTTPR